MRITPQIKQQLHELSRCLFTNPDKTVARYRAWCRAGGNGSVEAFGQHYRQQLADGWAALAQRMHSALSRLSDVAPVLRRDFR